MHPDVSRLCRRNAAGDVVAPCDRFRADVPIRLGLNYLAGALGAGCLIASFWLLWGSRLLPVIGSRWFYERPSMAVSAWPDRCNTSRFSAIRFLIVLGTGFALYGQFISFHIKVPLVQTLALTPFVVAVGNSPVSPGGIERLSWSSPWRLPGLPARAICSRCPWRNRF